MALFKLNAHVTVSAYTEVEADTLEEAIQEARSRSVEIGDECSGYSLTEHWLVMDADGEPIEIAQA